MEIRRLRDLEDKFTNTNGCDLDTILYSFDNIENKADNELSYGITTIYPGDINGEFYMTKGHRHEIDVAEVYFCLEGKGTLLVDDELVDMVPGKAYYVKPNQKHRVINTGDEELKFFCVYRSDAGHDYNVDFNKKLFK